MSRNTQLSSSIANILLRPSACLATALLYRRKFLQWSVSNSFVATSLLDEYMLLLASISLATKSTESPRRLRELLVPAHSLLRPASPALGIPSHEYDGLRDSLVRAELVILRVLGFDLCLPVPQRYLSQYVGTMLDDMGGVKIRDGVPQSDDYSIALRFKDMSRDKREEHAVLDVMQTRLGGHADRMSIDFMKMGDVPITFPARVIAFTSVLLASEATGFGHAESREKRISRLADSKVDVADVEDLLLVYSKHHSTLAAPQSMR